MPLVLDGAAFQEAGAVLQRLAAQVEGGRLTADGDMPLMMAAAWRGAAEALSLVAAAQGRQGG